jgi:DNA-binding winged helix-turn-helix (wHTH) protein
MAEIPEMRETLSTGDLVLDETSWTVHRAGEPVDLSPTEFRLLAYLMRHQGSVLSRAELLRDVWGGDYAGHAQIVETYVSYLRRKLHRFGPPVIHTRRGAGYTLQVLYPFDDGGVGLAATLAHGLQAQPAAGPLQFVQQLGHQDRAGGAQRVTERDGPAVRVRLLQRCPGLRRPGQQHRRERLVDLEGVDVVDAEPGLPESALLVAPIGPVSMMTGSSPITVIARIRARGVRPWRSTASPEAMSSAPAPSEICDDVAAVISQPSRSGGRFAIFSRVVSRRGPSSVATPFSGAISRSNLPSSIARIAR